MIEKEWPEDRSDQRDDFGKSSGELIKPNEDDDRIEVEEWEKGGGNPPSLKEFTLK